MSNLTSARLREETPHVNRTSRTNTIVNALKRRAQAVLNDKSIDPQTRAIIRYALGVLAQKACGKALHKKPAQQAPA